MKLNALLLDPARARRRRLGLPRARLRDAPRPRRGRLHRPLDRRPAGPRPAPRGRRLDHQALPPRGGDGADRSGRRAAAAAAAPSAETGPLVAGELEIRADQFQAFVGGDSLDLTRREFELLHLLADAKGQVLEREAIYQRVWGYAMAHGDRSVDVFIRKLRQKLEKRSPGWGYIHTHFGVGYRFDPEPARRRRRSAPALAAEAARPAPGAGAGLHKSFTTASPRGNRRPPARHARRHGDEPATPQRRRGRLEIRPEEHAALVDGRPLSLTMRELQLLITLAAHPQRIMTREELYAEVWGSEPRHDDRSVDVYVSRLRSKLGEALPGQQLIHTHNGIGYRFSPDG